MAIAKGKKAHVLAVPFPAQGHITPLMKLARLIASFAIKVTFVNIESVHNKIKPAAGVHENNDNFVLTSIPDGLSSDDDRKDPFKLLESLKSTMAGSLIDLIEKINSSNCDERISCILADISVGWIFEIAEKVGAQPVCFTPASAASLAMILHIPELIQQGNLDAYGTVTGSDTISLSDDIPSWRINELSWSFPVDLKTQKILFECSQCSEKAANFQTTLLLCNTFYDLESSACDLNPELLPIGPLLNNNNSKSSAKSSSFRAEDMSCLSWLSEKQANSVIYVAFGSLAVFSQHQIDELAIGLELSGRPFLWVVRSDLASYGSRVEYPDGFLERVGGNGLGKIVEWAPQEEVLCHPSIACFLSHCGWNSTMEGLSLGVPFLCWPYFADQHHNQSYICDKWKIGLRIEPDENGIRSRDEIKKKIEILFADDDLKVNGLRIKAMAAKNVAKGGSSFRNFQGFIDHLME